MRIGEGVEKQGGGGSRGRLHNGKGNKDERSSNPGSHGGGLSNEVSSWGVGRGTSAELLLAGGCSNKKRTCGMSAGTTL